MRGSQSMIKMEIKGKGHECRITVATPEQAIREVFKFIKEFYPEIKLEGLASWDTVPS